MNCRVGGYQYDYVPESRKLSWWSAESPSQRRPAWLVQCRSRMAVASSGTHQVSQSSPPTVLGLCALQFSTAKILLQVVKSRTEQSELRRLWQAEWDRLL